MKHLSMGLAALFLGTLPFAAAAFDYGPNQPLLAANQALPATDADLPAVPGSQSGPGAAGGSVRAESGEEANAGVPATPGVDHGATAAPTPDRAASASNANGSHHAAPPSSAALPAPIQPSWQSLLPGSIQ
jgi:hypothetical protein